jgi:uncharacterized membrane protein
MLPAYWLLVLFVLAGPVYAVLHAVSLVVPFYLVLLTIGLGTLFGLLRRSERPQFELEEIFTLLTVLLSVASAIVGFALAPLPIQIVVTIALIALWERYPANSRCG